MNKINWKDIPEEKLVAIYEAMCEDILQRLQAELNTIGISNDEKAKTTIKKITQVFVDLGIPAHAVEVIVHEIQKSHWGIGGEPASEKFKDIST